MAHPWDSQEGLPAGEGTGSGDGVQRVSQVNSQVSGVSGRPSCCDKIAQTWQLEGRTFPSHGCGGCKSKVTVPADSVSAEAPSGPIGRESVQSWCPGSSAAVESPSPSTFHEAAAWATCSSGSRHLERETEGGGSCVLCPSLGSP